MEACLAPRDIDRSVLDRLPAFAWQVDADAKVCFNNRAWNEFTGRTPEQTLGDGWLADLAPEDGPRCLQSYLEGFVKHQPFAVTCRLRRHDGEYRWVTLDAGPLCDRGGEFAGFLVLGQDAGEPPAADKSQAFRQAGCQPSTSAGETEPDLTRLWENEPQQSDECVER